MNIKFSAVVTPDSFSFVAPDGTSYSYQESMDEKVFIQCCEIIRDIQELQTDEREILSRIDPEDMEEGDPELDELADEQLHLIDELIVLLTPVKVIARQANGRVTVENGTVFFDGQPVHNAITENIIWGLNEGFNVTPYMRFMEKLQENPSKRAIAELFGFIQRYKLVIDEDGFVLAYKKITKDFFDCHSNTINNSIGKVVKVPRNMVDDDFGLLCSEGLHCCAFDYLPTYSGCHDNRVVIIKVHPKDVVSIPSDDAAKMRVCEYEVLREIPYNFGDNEHITEDHLAETPVWTHAALYHTDGVEVGDKVQYTGLVVKYNLIDKNEIYTVSKVQEWGGTTYISVDAFPDNTVFLYSEFKNLTLEGGHFATAEHFDDDDFDDYDDIDNGYEDE